MRFMNKYNVDKNFDDIFEVNPKVLISKNADTNFIEMKDLNPDLRIVESNKKKKFNGSGSKFFDGDTLFARITPCLENGKISQYRGDNVSFGSGEFIILRGRKGISTNDFTYYYSNWDKFRQYAIKNMVGTSGRQRVPPESLKSWKTNIPDIETQKKITFCLSQFDNKIELNQKKIQVLKKIINSKFISWFIDFESNKKNTELSLKKLKKKILKLFPDKLEDSELGKIPKNGKIVTLGDLIDRKKQKIGGKKFKIFSAVNSSELILSDEYFNKQVYSKKQNNYLKVEKYDFAFNPSRINIGSIGMNKFNFSGAVSPVYIVFKPKFEFQWFIENFLKFDTIKNKIKQLSFGSVRQSLSYDDLCSIKLIKPDTNLLIIFNKFAKSFEEKIKNINDQTKILIKTRDEILPHLISGELSVENIKDYFEKEIVNESY